MINCMVLTYEDTLKRYAELKIEEKKVTAELKDLNPLVREGMESRGLDKQPTSVGDFLILKKKAWKYTEECETLRQALKNKESDEEARGLATFVEKSELQFRVKKDEGISKKK